MTVTCPNRCGKAGLVIGVDERSIKEHLSQQCAARTVDCPRGCGVVLSVSALPVHDDSCIRNSIACPNHCFMIARSLQFVCCVERGLLYVPTRFQKIRLAAHLDHDCPAVGRQCERRAVTVKRCELAAHERCDSHQLRDAQNKIRLLSRVVSSLISKLECPASEKSELKAAMAELADVNSSAVQAAASSYSDAACGWRMGDRLDALDTKNRWWKARVVATSADNEHLYIEYDCWDDKWNEWIPARSARIAQYRSVTVQWLLT